MHEIEDIPDSDNLYYRVHKNDIREEEVLPGAFKERGEGMSTNWDKYSSPEDLIKIATVPHDNCVIELNVGAVRTIEDLVVIHAPIVDNQAHSHVIGIPRNKSLKTKVRAKLQEIYEWRVK